MSTQAQLRSYLRSSQNLVRGYGKLWVPGSVLGTRRFSEFRSESLFLSRDERKLGSTDLNTFSELYQYSVFDSVLDLRHEAGTTN